MAGSLAAFYRRIPVAHVEAGLRTGDLARPFPEELNRVVTGRVADLHFAPTERARRNLLTEGTPAERIFITGNTGIDALFHVVEGLEQGRVQSSEWPWMERGRKLVLVTAHRRENFGEGIERICRAIAELARRDDTQVVYPVHRNPKVLGPVTERLGGLPNVMLLPPLDYRAFVDLMRRCYLVITDSGGVQEEAPSLGKPVLVMRESTERPEAVEAGTVELVGDNPARIVEAAARLLSDERAYRRMSVIHNPYGDGHAAERIVDRIAERVATSVRA
jgi:UDP-N-acetylglucosamine 2-epimerase (non-hydrolysing)